MNPLSKPQIKSNQNSPDGDPIALSYNVDRPRDDHPLTAPFIRFRGMAFARRGSPAQYEARHPLTAIATFGRLPRIYCNALLARGTESDEGIPLAKRWDDIRLMAKLLEVAPPHELSDLGKAFPHEQTGDNSINYGRLPKHAQRCHQDAELISRLYYNSGMRERIRNEGLDFIYRLERNVVNPTLAMIYAGVRVKRLRLGDIVGRYNLRVFALRDQLARIGGPKIRFGSAEQMTAVIHEKLKLPVIQRTSDGNPSLDDRTLRRLAELDRSGFVAVLRKFQRMVSLQRDNNMIYRRVDRDTKRAHPDLDPLATSSGRFGCSDPPLLAVPDRLLNVIVADKGRALVEAEFSQFELRVLAHFTQDRALLRTFREHGKSVDLHRRTAAIVLGIREDQVTDNLRNRIGKVINLGIVTGQTEQGMAEVLNVPVEQAAYLFERFFQIYPRVRKWIDAVERDAESKGCARSLYGRRQTLANVDAGDADHSRSMRPAVNHVIEGTASDIFKLAIRRLYRALPSSCWMLLPLHDSLLFEVPRGDVSRIAPLIKQVLEEPPPDFSVPLVVKIRCGKTWAECREAPCEEIDA